MTEEVKAAEQKVAEQQEIPSTPPQSADLNINDLIAIRNILEVASQRGAFRAAELESVGKTFNKLNAFLDTVAAGTKQES
jgi:hypothetical protein